MLKSVVKGAAAGAAGTTALNAVTYLDMLVRGRPASNTPEQTVSRLSNLVGVEIPGDDQTRAARVTSLGALTGVLTGTAVGSVLGAASGAGLRLGPAGPIVAGVLAMTAANVPMALLGVSSPQQWAAKDWVADLIPHLAYGVVTWATLKSTRPRR